MIHTPRRYACPAHLAANADGWTKRFQQNPRREWATRKAKGILRPVLCELAFGKCVYCESVLEVTGYTEVDHYIAKTVNSALVFEWSNLLPACRRCNNAKGEQHHGGTLLKPDDEDPEPFFWIHPDTGKLEPHPQRSTADQRRAAETIRICDLQRPALCEERYQMLLRVSRWVQRLSESGTLTRDLQEEWKEFLDPRREYKLVLRHMLTLKQQSALADLDRQAFRAP
jgi:uncharacterized protein (TIGR02646 family)